MGRLLVLVVLAVLAIWLIRRALLGASRAPDQARGGVPAAKAEGDLVKCARCGTHLPLAEARAAGDRLYCSDEHARLGPRVGPGSG
jgi:uncharacterized protein